MPFSIPVIRKTSLRLLAGALFVASVGLVPAQADQFILGSSGEFAGGLTLNGDSYVTDSGQFLPGFSNQGWWSATAGNSDDNTNYIVGSIGTNFYNNFFTFDLSGLSTTVTSATLSIVTFNTSSADLPVTYSLYDVTTDAATLNANIGPDGVIYADLGSGVKYGEIAVGAYPPFVLEIELNSAALAAINAAAGGYFSIGGTLSPSAAVPEPSTVGLTGIAFGALLGITRRKQRSRSHAA